MIATNIEQSKQLVRLGLDPKTADMCWITENHGVTYHQCPVAMPWRNYTAKEFYLPAWSLSALLDVMPRPDLYRETADLWVCATFFKEGSIRGYGETAVDAACDTITKMFGRGYLKKKGGQDGNHNH